MAILPKIAIIYASSMGRTKLMAEAVAEGAKSIPGIKILLKDISYAVPEDVSDADAIVLGSTCDGDLHPSVTGFLDAMERMDLHGKIGVPFGSYASGEGESAVLQRMRSSGLWVFEPCLETRRAEENARLQELFMLGRSVAQGVRNGPGA